MTIDECKKYLPNRWAEIIQQDPLLMEIFEEHDLMRLYRLNISAMMKRITL